MGQLVHSLDSQEREDPPPSPVAMMGHARATEILPDCDIFLPFLPVLAFPASLPRASLGLLVSCLPLGEPPPPPVPAQARSHSQASPASAFPAWVVRLKSSLDQ